MSRIDIKTMGLVFRSGPNGPEILGTYGEDKTKGEAFYRILGGGVEFGETAQDALVREFREELSAEIKVHGLLGWLENIFTYNGQPGHQVTAVFDVSLADPALYQQDSFTIDEGAKGVFTAHWVSVADVLAGRAILYPDGLQKFLQDRISA